MRAQYQSDQCRPELGSEKELLPRIQANADRKIPGFETNRSFSARNHPRELGPRLCTHINASEEKTSFARTWLGLMNAGSKMQPPPRYLRAYVSRNTAHARGTAEKREEPYISPRSWPQDARSMPPARAPPRV